MVMCPGIECSLHTLVIIITRQQAQTYPLTNTHTLQLANTLLPQELYPGVSVTTLSGMLSFKNNKHILHPHPHPTGKQLWGQPSVDGLVQALKEVN